MIEKLISKMITTFNPIIEKTEKPDKLTPKNVQYYSSHTHQLAHSQVHKAILFVENDLIQYDEVNKVFYCLPIQGYNKTPYKLENKGKGFECDCQACQTKIKQGLYNPDIEENAVCSHILALMYYFKIKHWNKNG